MKPEQKMWNTLRNLMGRSWSAERHEDSLGVGIPDVSFGIRKVGGWIELKALPAWPKRIETVVRPKRYSTAQKIWLYERGEAGGHVWLLLRVGKMEWLLFNHKNAQQVGQVNIVRLKGLCSAYWNRIPSAVEFADAITR